jgi:hypothetical protein
MDWRSSSHRAYGSECTVSCSWFSTRVKRPTNTYPLVPWAMHQHGWAQKRDTCLDVSVERYPLAPFFNVLFIPFYVISITISASTSDDI